jgi:hypothetical protein
VTLQPSPFEIVRAIQDQQRATDRLVAILVGMLDKSAPDPFVGAVITGHQETMPVIPIKSERPWRRAIGDAGRPPVFVELDGVQVRTTERRAKLIQMLKDETIGLTDLCRRRLFPNTKAAASQLRDINGDLERSGSSWRVTSDRPRGSRRAAQYRLVETIQKSGIPTLPGDAEAHPPAGLVSPLPVPSAGEANLPETASESARRASSLSGNAALKAPDAITPESDHVDRSASAQPHSAQGEPAIPSKPGDAGRGQGHERPNLDIEPAGAAASGAVRTGAPIPEIAGDQTAINSGQMNRLPDQGPVGREECETAQLGPSTCEMPSGAKSGGSVGTAPPPPRRAAGKPLPRRELVMMIDPGDLIAVDVKAREIVTLKGIYQVGGANLARALEKLKGGQMFGLDVVARVAGWHSAEVAAQALRLERNRLAAHGIDVYLDKINVRLRVLS